MYKELFGIFSEHMVCVNNESATWPPVKKKENVPRIICHQLRKTKIFECNLPPITKLKSWMRRISRQWGGGKVHGLDIGKRSNVISANCLKKFKSTY